MTSGQAKDRPLTFIRLPKVMSRVTRSRSSIYQGMAEGTFPQCVPIGGRSVAWIEYEIDDWIVSKIEASRGTERPAAEQRS